MTTRPSLLCAIVPLLCCAASAAEPDIVFLAPTNHTMPMAHFRDGALDDGILHDLGLAIAARMGLHARFVSAPSKRVALMLQEGAADGVCYVRPQWIDGEFRWSMPVIPDAGVLVARSDAPAVGTLADLARRPVGTVAGYRYARFSTALGADFVRDDAPSTENNIQKLLRGRTQYAIMEKSTLLYLRRQHAGVPLRTDLEFDTFKAQCAFSLRARIPFAAANRAIESLLRDGSVERLLGRYR